MLHLKRAIVQFIKWTMVYLFNEMKNYLQTSQNFCKLWNFIYKFEDNF